MRDEQRATVLLGRSCVRPCAVPGATAGGSGRGGHGTPFAGRSRRCTAPRRPGGTGSGWCSPRRRACCLGSTASTGGPGAARSATDQGPGMRGDARRTFENDAHQPFVLQCRGRGDEGPNHIALFRPGAIWPKVRPCRPQPRDTDDAPSSGKSVPFRRMELIQQVVHVTDGQLARAGAA